MALGVSRGAIAGAIGGLAGAWAMSRFAEGWIAMSDGRAANEDRAATELLVQRMASAAGRPLTHQQVSLAAPAVHYALGAAMGAAYGAWAERARANAVVGLAWGTLVWIGTGTAGAQLLGRSSLRQMPGISAQGLAVHAVYGLTNEVVRAGVRAAI